VIHQYQLQAKPAYNSLAEFGWLPDITKIIGGKENITVEKVLFVFFQKFFRYNSGRLEMQGNNMCTAGTGT
jgi:hypothetical protein